MNTYIETITGSGEGRNLDLPSDVVILAEDEEAAMEKLRAHLIAEHNKINEARFRGKKQWQVSHQRMEWYHGVKAAVVL